MAVKEFIQLPTKDYVWSLDVSGDGNYLVASCQVLENTPSLFIYDLNTNSLYNEFEMQYNQSIDTVRFCKNDQCIIYPIHDYVIIRDIHNGEIQQEIMCSGIKEIKVSSEQDKILLIGELRTLQVWDLSMNKKVWDIKDSKIEFFDNSWTPDSLHVSWHVDKELIDSQRKFQPTGDFMGETEILIVGASRDKIITMNFFEDKIMNQIYEGPLQANGVCISSNSHFLFTIGSIPEGDMIYDLSNGKRVLTDIFDGNLGSSSNVIFDHSNTTIITGSRYGFIGIDELDDDGDTLFSEQIFNGDISEICWIKNTKKIVFGAEGGRLCVCDLSEELNK